MASHQAGQDTNSKGSSGGQPVTGSAGTHAAGAAS